MWELAGVTAEPDGTIAAVLTLAANDISRAFDPAEFSLLYTVRFGATLNLGLTVTNAGASAMRFEEALHTYLAVGDVRRVGVSGLEGAEYYDKTDGMKRKRQEGAVTIGAETDRLYIDTAAAITLDDPVLWRAASSSRRRALGRRSCGIPGSPRAPPWPTSATTSGRG